jgi:hypothetical protein
MTQGPQPQWYRPTDTNCIQYQTFYTAGGKCEAPRRRMSWNIWQRLNHQEVWIRFHSLQRCCVLLLRIYVLVRLLATISCYTSEDKWERKAGTPTLKVFVRKVEAFHHPPCILLLGFWIQLVAAKITSCSIMLVPTVLSYNPNFSVCRINSAPRSGMLSIGNCTSETTRRQQ